MNRNEMNPAMAAKGCRWKRYPAYKDTDIEWIPELPDHWQTKQLKYVCGINRDVLSEDTPEDFELRYLDISSVDSLGRIVDEQMLLFADAPSRARRRVCQGDTILSTVRTYLRAIAFMDAPPPNQIVSTGFAVLRPLQTVDPRFLWRLVLSVEFIDSVVSHSVGIGYPAINPIPTWSIAGLAAAPR